MAKFDPRMYVTAYELAREGHSDEQIAGALGVAGNTLRTWARKRPAFADALARGRAANTPGGGQDFADYIYQHLPAKLQELWEQIHECKNLVNARERVEALLAGHGTRARQHLFVHALVRTTFNVSKALRMLCISRKQYDYWCSSDPDFHELMDEINWHKNNFFEQAFMMRVAAGDSPAIIHAAKTKLRHRGYNEKHEVEITGQVNHLHAHIDIAQLDLPVDVLEQVLMAVRAQQQATGVQPLGQRLAVAG